MEVKDYMSKREIANLFECLMTGLLYHRPEDYVEYLIECLNKIKTVGVDAVRWDMFLEAKRAKTPLPPIGSRENGTRGGDLNTSTPLPPIGSSSPVTEDRTLAANVPLLLVNGGPGSGKDSFCDLLTKRFSGLLHISTSALLREKLSHLHKDALDSGELLPDEVVVPVLSDAIKNLVSKDTPGVLLTGFPRSVAQADLLQRHIGSVKQMLLIDYDEEDLKHTLERRCKEGGRADDEELPSSRRLKNFKEETLPVCKHYEDQDKLMLIEGNQDRAEILQMLTKVLELQFGRAADIELKFPSPRPPSVPRPGYSRPAPFTQPTVPEDEFEEHGGIRIRRIEPAIKDAGRKIGAPTCPIIAVLGGPGSGRSTQAEAISKNFEDFISVNFEKCSNDSQELFAQVDAIQGSENPPKGIVLDGFPWSEDTISEFNEKIGGIDLVILVDCFEDLLRQRCMAQPRAGSDMENEIAKFKESGLSVVRHYDLQGKLEIVLGNQDVELVTNEVVNIINTKIFDKEMQENGEAHKQVEGGVEKPQDHSAETEKKTEAEAVEEHPDASKEEAKAEDAAPSEEKKETEKKEEEETEKAAEESKTEEAAEKESGRNAEEVSEEKAASDKTSSEAVPAEEDAEASLEKVSSEAAPAEEPAEAAPAEEPTEESPAEESAEAPPAEESSEAAPAEESAEAPPAEESSEAAPAEESAEVPPAEASSEAAPAEESAEAPPAEEPTEAAPAEASEGAEVKPADEDADAEALKSIKVIFVIGGPGSGKGTQCENILKDYNVGHVSTGDLMRAEVESGSDLGKELKATMEKGELVTLDTVLKLLKASLVKMSTDKKCFLIDGFPREREQGVRFENEVTECACCLFFEVDQEVMVQRLLKRGETSGRVDDNEETIRKRLKTFVDNTDPILSYFQEKTKLEKIVASGTIDEIYGKVKEALDKASIEKKS